MFYCLSCFVHVMLVTHSNNLKGLSIVLDRSPSLHATLTTGLPWLALTVYLARATRSSLRPTLYTQHIYTHFYNISTFPLFLLCTHVCTYTHTCTSSHAHTQTHTHTHSLTHTHTYTHLTTYTHTYAHIHTNMHTHTH